MTNKTTNSVEIRQGDDTRADRGSHVTITKSDSGKWIAGLFLAVALVVALAWGINAFRFTITDGSIEGGNIDTTSETEPRP